MGSPPRDVSGSCRACRRQPRAARGPGYLPSTGCSSRRPYLLKRRKRENRNATMKIKRILVNLDGLALCTSSGV